MNFMHRLDKAITEAIILSESQCPACGQQAYVGLNEVECSNPQCQNYKGSQKLGVSMWENVDGDWSEHEVDIPLGVTDPIDVAKNIDRQIYIQLHGEEMANDPDADLAEFSEIIKSKGGTLAARGQFGRGATIILVWGRDHGAVSGYLGDPDAEMWDTVKQAMADI